MELQLRVARTTVDIDLTLPASLNISPKEAPPTATVREILQEATSLDLRDWFVYTVGAPMDLDAAPYGGERYPIECRMDGRTFARFHLGVGDLLILPLQKIRSHDWLGFAEIPADQVRLISKEQQVAEKPAYTLPRSTPNSRVKDPVDLLLLGRTGEVRYTQLTEAVCMTFDRRKTHAIPSALVPPPDSWEGQFRALAAECGIASGMDGSFHEGRDVPRSSPAFWSSELGREAEQLQHFPARPIASYRLVDMKPPRDPGCLANISHKMSQATPFP